MRQGLHGVRTIHELYVATPSYLEQEKAVRKKEETIRKGVEKLYKSCRDRQLPAPGVNEYLAFRLMKSIFTEETAPAYYELYRGKEYYYNVKISPIARLAAGAIVPLAMWMAKDNMPGDVKWPR